MSIPLSFLYTIAGAIFGAGGAWTAVKFGLAKEITDRKREDEAIREDLKREDQAIRKDLNGIGSKLRQHESRAERRWKHAIAAQSKDEQTAKLLREDAWRD